MPEGLSRTTGELLSGWPYVLQFLIDFWTTPRGSRVLRRPYGGDVLNLIDRPGNQDACLAVLMAAVEVHQWQPWFRLQTLQMVTASPSGKFEVLISGLYYPNAPDDYTVVESMTGVRVTL